MIVEIACPQRLENGLVVPGKFMAFAKSGDRTKIKTTLQGLNGKETVLLHVLMLV